MWGAIATAAAPLVGGLMSQLMGGSAKGSAGSQTQSVTPVYNLNSEDGTDRSANNIYDMMMGALSPMYKQFQLGNIGYEGMPGISKPLYDTVGMNYQQNQGQLLSNFLSNLLGVKESYGQTSGAEGGYGGPMAQAIARSIPSVVDQINKGGSSKALINDIPSSNPGTYGNWEQ